MAGRANHVDQLAAMARAIEVAPHAAALRTHLRHILESRAFRGSRRSQEFLRFIVERALDGHFDDLKERTLGVELFGRAPAYDTGEDAIVRVTACDVRKRLAQFYSDFAEDFDFRMELPPGSYIPEFRGVESPARSRVPDVKIGELSEPAVVFRMPAPHPDPVAPEALARTRGFPWLAVMVPALLVVLSAFVWLWNQRRAEAVRDSPVHTLPWSALIRPESPARVIFCDPEIVTVQRLLNYSVSLSDYANQHFWPAPETLKPDARRVLQAVSFRGATVAAVDAGIALKIDSLMLPSSPRPLEMHTARNVHLSDFKTEASFILFGSPRSNPWVELFQDQLDFRFEFDPVRRAEFVRNKRPAPGEPPVYVPTAEGWGTGQAYAIVALVGNPGQKGSVLLLAGSNAEATEAAGKLATDPEALSAVLKSHGIDLHGGVRHFEVLLKVATMAGSPNTADVIAFHLLEN